MRRIRNDKGLCDAGVREHNHEAEQKKTIILISTSAYYLRDIGHPTATMWNDLYWK